MSEDAREYEDQILHISKLIEAYERSLDELFALTKERLETFDDLSGRLASLIDACSKRIDGQLQLCDAASVWLQHLRETRAELAEKYEKLMRLKEGRPPADNIKKVPPPRQVRQKPVVAIGKSRRYFRDTTPRMSPKPGSLVERIFKYLHHQPNHVSVREIAVALRASSDSVGGTLSGNLYRWFARTEKDSVFRWRALTDAEIHRVNEAIRRGGDLPEIDDDGNQNES